MRKFICLLFGILFFSSLIFAWDIKEDPNGYYWLSGIVPMDREKISYLQELLYGYMQTSMYKEKSHRFFLACFDIDNVDDLTKIGMSIYSVYERNESARKYPVGWILGQIVIPILNAEKIDENEKLKDMEKHYKLLTTNY